MRLTPPGSGADIPSQVSATLRSDKYVVSAVFAGAIGFLVYFGLFASFSRTFDNIAEASITNDELIAFLQIWKLIIFVPTMWFVRSIAAQRHDQLARGGALIVGFGAGLLFLVESGVAATVNSHPVVTRLVVLGIEAFGEAFIYAGLISFIRLETKGHDWNYFRSSTGLRIGQNLGIVIALLAVGLKAWEYPRMYSAFLLAIRVLAFILVVLLVRKTVTAETDYEPSRPRTASVVPKRFVLDVVAGGCAYALFYLVVIGPKAVLSNYEPSMAMALNGGFATASTICIYVWSRQAHKRTDARPLLLKFDTLAAYGAVIVVVLWILSMYWVAEFSGSATLVALASGLLGLFTTATYVLGELSSGISGKSSSQSEQIVSYVALARLGPALALVMIWIARLFLHKNPEKRELAVFGLVFFVAVGAGALWKGVADKRKFAHVKEKS